jgi:phosphatidylinositol alpha 1,6-mannosyltransferase
MGATLPRREGAPGETVEEAAAPFDGTDRSAAGLRVALVTGSYNYIKDGVALTLNRLVEYLERQGAEVLVFAPVARRPAFKHAGTIVPVMSIPIPGLGRSEYRISLGLRGDARRRFKAFDPHIVHVATPDFAGLTAQELARSMGRPVVASYHTRYDTYLRHYGLNWWRRGLNRRLNRFFDEVLEVYVPSPSMIEELEAEGRRNLRLWPRGVDAERFHPGRRDDAWREALGVEPEEIIVAFVSRLVKEKRLATLVDALAVLRDRGVPHRVLIVGDGPEREALEDDIPDALFTGFLDGDELARAYASSDIFLFPSDTETFGNVTLEAMASGLPTVCADATGSRSLVKAGATGYLAPAADGVVFATKVAALIADAPLRRRMGAAARQRSLTFSWDEAMAGVLARYLALTGRNPPPRGGGGPPQGGGRG